MVHSHHHDTAHYGTAFAIGIVLNLGFVLIEAFYGWQTNSMALLADALGERTCQVAAEVGVSRHLPDWPG